MLMPRSQIPEGAQKIPDPETAILDKLGSYLAKHPDVLRTDQCLKCLRRYPSGTLLCEGCPAGTEVTPSPSLRRAVRLVVNEMGIIVMKPGRVFFDGDMPRLDGWELDIRPWLARQGIVLKVAGT